MCCSSELQGLIWNWKLTNKTDLAFYEQARLVSLVNIQNFHEMTLRRIVSCCVIMLVDTTNGRLKQNYFCWSDLMRVFVRWNRTQKIFVVVFKMVAALWGKRFLIWDVYLHKTAAVRKVSFVSKLFICFQTLGIKIHKQQSYCNIMFFPSTEIAGLKNISSAIQISWPRGRNRRSFKSSFWNWRQQFSNQHPKVLWLHVWYVLTLFPANWKRFLTHVHNGTD